MSPKKNQIDTDEVKRAAAGRWLEVLHRFGFARRAAFGRGWARVERFHCRILGRQEPCRTAEN